MNLSKQIKENKRMKKSYYLGIALLLFTIFIAGCKKEEKKSTGQTEMETQTLFAVDTIKVAKGEISDYIKLTGDVKSKRDVQIFPDQSGKIANIYVRLGQEVRKGQILVDIDPSKPGMIYSNSPVFSSVAGTITSLPYKIGETVNTQSPIANVGRLDELEIITYVAEKYISKMRENLPAFVTVDAYPDLTIKGYTYEISPVVDQQSRMLEIKINLNDPNFMLLKPGMHADLKIVTDRKFNTVKIPSTCITRRYGEAFVFVITEIPTEITNTGLEYLLNEAPEEEKEILLSYFPKKLPKSFRTDVFEYRLLKSLEKDAEGKGILESLYTYDKENETYQLKEETFSVAHEKAWKLLLSLGQKYTVTTPKEKKSSKVEDEALREIFIKKGMIEKSTKFVEKRVIKPGIEIDNKTEVNSGLLADEEIVYSGQSLLENNARVKVIQTLNIAY